MMVYLGMKDEYQPWGHIYIPSKPARIPDVASYLLDTPTSAQQMRHQQVVSGLTGGLLAQYHQSKESMARMSHIMGVYGVSFADIKYPYLTSLSQGTSVYSTYGSLMSRNISRLYRGL